MKKGQLTIFIIIAILITAVVVLFFSFRGNLQIPEKPVSPETAQRLGIVYDAVAEFVGEDLTTSEGICVSCLLDINDANNLKATFFDYDNKTNIFIIEDPQSKLNNKEFVYVFANEY